jgi:SsrA-binding protein
MCKYLLILFGFCLLSAPVTSFVVSTLARCSQTVLYSTPGFKQSIIADNRQAKGDYEFEEYYHGGIQLRGSEVKSCRTKGSCNLKSGFIEIREGEAWLYELHIAEATRCGPIYQHEPKRTRKVLLHSKEILKLEQRVLQRNMGLIPTELYWSDKNFVKVEIGVGKKKTINDKRDDMIKKDGQASIRRVMKGGFD